MKEEKILNIVNSINNGDIEDLDTFFGGIDRVLNFLEKEGYLHLIDPFNDNFSNKQKNTLIYHILDSEEKGQEVMNKLISSLGDVYRIGDDWWVVADPEDLAVLFKSYSREVSPEDIAKSVLSEDYWEPFWDTTSDVYRDVIEELNPQNKQRLKEKIVELLSNKQITITSESSDLMEELSKEQGHPDYLIIDNENISQIVDDEETMNSLLDDELVDLKGELYNVHNSAFNGAYNDEYYNKVWDELKTYIDSERPETYKWGNKYRNRYKITNNVERVIKDWFYEYRKYDDDFDYRGTYLGLITQLMDESSYEKLSLRIDDYPDYREVDKNINLIFSDYI